MFGKKYIVGVVGALGMVGSEMRRTLERRKFPIKELRPLDVPEAEGQTVEFRGKNYTVLAAQEESFKGVDIALFSAGAEASLELAPLAVRQGAVVVDNSSVWRMDPEKPLVVPEVNAADLKRHKGIVANPNCSTIQMVVALKPLHDAARIKRVVVSTYQATSGAGKKGSDALTEESKAYLETGMVQQSKGFQHQIAFNCIPHIDVFQEYDYTKEEYKMVNETQKIMNDESIKVTATCVRVPVWYGHAESINIETEKKLTASEAKKLLAAAENVVVIDDPQKNEYPMPLFSNDRDETMVGRIREDLTIANGLNLWVVSNNIRKGAALNAVQVAEALVKMKLVRVP